MYCVKLHKSTNLKMCLRLTEMYSKVIHPNAFNITRFVYNDTTIIKNIRK